jgi:glycosyltransferase involved in cell wall biosynthesis
MKTVLLDLTSLDTPSRNRGHGRYVRELALGLDELPPSERGELNFLALTHLNLAGAHRITEEIAAFEGTPGQPSPGPQEHYRWAYARRFGLFRALRQLDVAAVHLADPNASPLLMSLTRCKKVVTCHDVIPARYPKIYFGIRDGGPLLGLAIERRRYRSADLVVAISDATERDARTILGVRPERMTRVYNGVDVERWSIEPAPNADAVLQRHGLSEKAFALYVGGPDWHKNVEGMLAGLAAAKSQLAEVHLAWAGKLNGPQTADLSGLVQKFGLQHAVSFLGFVPDDELSVLYRHARAHVLVSWCEGFGLTVVEAMACGCPVLTTGGGSLEEVAGDAAIKVDPADAAQIGSSLVRLFREPELRAQLAERGRMRAPRFSRAVQARAMVSAYCALLNH